MDGCHIILIYEPNPSWLYAAGDVDVRIEVPVNSDLSTLVVTLDDGNTITDVTGQLAVNGYEITGQVSAPATGDYTLRTSVAPVGTGPTIELARTFKVLALTNPDNCEILNAANCMLPYPSDVFLADDGARPAGFNPKRMNIDASALPTVVGTPLDPAPYNVLDGFSPTAQILMHFPGTGVDLAASGASRLLPPPAAAVAKPYTDLRTHDDTSLQASSPSVLIDAATGERIRHFLEVDARALGNPNRQTLVMRPAKALSPGHRYIVAMRNLKQIGGAAIQPETAFHAIRANRHTTVDAINARKPHYEAEIFPQLAHAGVERNSLILAFDFTVQSDEALTREVLAMRDESYAWLANGNAAFSVASVVANDCSVPGTTVWRIVRGTYQVPLFLTADPEVNINSLGVLNDPDGDGTPDANGVTNPPYTISLPCSALEASPPTAHSLLLGHGLFGNGDGMVTGFGDVIGGTYIAGATDWRGLSSPDLFWVIFQVVGFGTSKLNNFPALPDRLKQGQINTQVLARMMKHGLFNTHPCFEIRDTLPANCITAGPDVTAVGVFPGSPSVDVEMFYFGVSLGGIMGTWFAALTPDVERFNVDVPAMNFSLLLQRSTQFVNFDPLLDAVGLADPMNKILGLGLIHELWVKGEPAGYVHRLADEVASNAKKLLVTVAWLDKQVSNQATEIMVRSLGVPNHDSSVLQGLVGIPDVSGLQDSAMVIYDTGSFDLFNPAHQPFIPALANLIPSGVCDPHGAPRISIPASLDQVQEFLQPGGRIENFCTSGLCDGVGANNQPAGGACDPLNP